MGNEGISFSPEDLVLPQGFKFCWNENTCTHTHARNTYTQSNVFLLLSANTNLTYPEGSIWCHLLGVAFRVSFSHHSLSLLRLLLGPAMTCSSCLRCGWYTPSLSLFRTHSAKSSTLHAVSAHSIRAESLTFSCKPGICKRTIIIRKLLLITTTILCHIACKFKFTLPLPIAINSTLIWQK